MNKILHLRASNFYGGPERQIHFHALLSLQSDFQVTVASFAEQNKTPDLLSRAEQDNIPTHLFEVRSSYDRHAISMIRSWLHDNEYQILCTHDYRSNILGWAATRKTKVLWVPFSRGKTSENLKVRIFHLMDSRIMKRANRIVAVSGGEAKRLVSKGIEEKRISVVHNAANVDAFTSIEPVDLHEKYELPHDAFVCLAAGRFSKEKGQLILIKAAAEAIKQNRRLHFLLFGDGPDFDAAKQQVTNLDLQSKVILPGFEQNLIGCMKGADLVINPSLSEGLPNVVLEAMAVGTPVIATAVGGVPELLSDGQNGSLIRANDIPALTTAILRLCEDRELAKDYALEALETVKNDFSFEAQHERLTQLYRQVINND